MKKILFVFFLLLLPQVAVAGSQTYSTPGTYSFTVPNYGTLTVQAWGGGGGGGIMQNYSSCDVSGGNGGDSSFGSVVGRGGRGAYDDPSCVAPGGVASGGDVNLQGGSSGVSSWMAGVPPNGGSSPNGGAGGYPNSCVTTSYAAYCNDYPAGGGPPSNPGGGAGGGYWTILNDSGGAGGAGGYASKTYSAGSLSPGNTVTVVVGNGGASGEISGYSCHWLCAGNYRVWADAGAPGKVTVTWTDAAPASPTNLSSSCSADGTRVTLSWTGNPSALTYPLRVDDPNTYTSSNCSNSTVSGPSRWCPTPTDYANEAGYSGITLTIRPGVNYRWWVHSWNTSGWSNPPAEGYFTCTAPRATCSLTTNAAVISASSKNAYWGSNTGVTFSWTTQNANTFSIYPAPTTMWMTPVSSGSWQYGPINQTTTFTGTATNGSGVGGNCTATVTVPTEPVGYSHTCSADGTQATLSWGTSSGATSYGLRVDNRSVGSACNGITGVPTNKNGGCWQQYWPYSSAYGYTGNPGYTDYIEDNIPLSTHSKTVTISPAGSPVTWWVHGVSPKNAPFTGYAYNTYTYGGYAYSDFTFTTFTCSAPVAPTCSVTLSPNPASYSSTGTATLAWSATNANTSVYINNVGYMTGSSGSFTVPRTATTDYSCTAVGSGGTGTQAATLTVTPPALPTATITSSRGTSMQVGQSATITATFSAASNDALSADAIDYPAGTHLTTTSVGSKTYTFTPNGPGTYTFYARATSQYFTSWTTYRTVTVTVNSANPACTLSLNPTTITRGQSSTLSWTSTNTTGGTISPTVGSVGPNSSTPVSPTQSTTYTGVFNGPGNSTAQCNNGTGVTLTVTCPLAYSCSGQTIMYTNANCSTTNVTTCVSPEFCSAGSPTCLTSTPSFNPGSNGLTGHLQVRPSLVRKKGTATAYWNVSNVESCTVRGNTVDKTGWSGTSGAQTTSALSSRTTYTLDCLKLNGTHLIETAFVNIVPEFEER